MAAMENSPDLLRLTRNELYERAWATPIIRLAEEFGITNLLLSGTCRKHQIPTPPAGYWSKVAHDKPLSRPPPADTCRAIIEPVVPSPTAMTSTSRATPLFVRKVARPSSRAGVLAGAVADLAVSS